MARAVSTSGQDARAEKLAAFERLVVTYEAALLRYAARILCDANAAQDVVQTAFLRAYHSWSGAWEPSPPLSSWLYRVTHNAAVDHLRRERRMRLLHEKEAEERPEDLPPDRGAGFRISDDAAAAANALHALSLRDQQLVILKVYEEKSYKEISEITGLTVSNVGYILHHAMKKLAEALRGGGVPPPPGDAHAEG